MILGELPIKIMMKDLSIKKDDYHVRFGLGILLSIWIAQPAVGQSEQQDIREQCRSEVSGFFLTVHNDVDNLRDYIKVGSDQIRRLRIRHGSLLAELETLRKKAAAERYDRLMEESLMATENMVQQVTAELAQGEQLLAAYQERLKLADERLHEVTPIILKVFQKVFPEDLKTSKGYRFRLAYREACSRFQYLCPLSPQGRKHLSDISKVLGGIQNCDRYAEMQIDL